MVQTDVLGSSRSYCRLFHSRPVRRRISGHRPLPPKILITWSLNYCFPVPVCFVYMTNSRVSRLQPSQLSCLLVSMDTNSANRIWCSQCSLFRDSESFEMNKSGKTKKQCNRHGKKRDAVVLFDGWDIFEGELRSWNHTV